LAFAPGVAVERGETELYGCEACSVDDDEVALLIEVGEDAGRSFSSGEGEEELQRVDVDEDGEEEGEVDPEGGGVVSEKLSTREPDLPRRRKPS
jgi:hypothetical protein